MLDHQDQATNEPTRKIELVPLPVVQTLTFDEYRELSGHGQLIEGIRSLESQIKFERIINSSEPFTGQALEQLTPEVISGMTSEQKAQLLLMLSNRSDTGSFRARELLLVNLQASSTADLQSAFDQLLTNDFELAFRLAELSNDQQFVASQILNAELRAIINTISDINLRQELLKAPDDTRSLLKLFNYLDQRSATDLLWHIHKLSELHPTVANDLERVWDNALQNTCLYSHINFINCALSNYSDLAEQHIIQTLQSSQDLKELNQVINSIGEMRLLGTGSNEIKEILATASLLTQMQNVKFPDYLKSTLTLEQINSQLDLIAAGYQDMITICKSSMYASTNLAADLINMAESSLIDLADDVKAILKSIEQENPPVEEVNSWLNNELSQLTGADRLSTQQIKMLNDRIEEQLNNPETIEQRLTELANTYLKMSQLERCYAVDLSYGPAGFLDLLLGKVGADRTVKLWSMNELLAIEQSLKEIPEGHLLFSPHLHHIQKVTSLGSGVLAARFHTGEIRVAEIASLSREIIHHYPGIHPLAIVLTHELGHSLQIGSGYTDPEKKVVNGINLGEPRYDFEEYLKISGWTALDQERWQIIPAEDWFMDDLVELDGELYPLGEIIEHNGEKLVLIYYNRLLLSYNPDSEWSSRWYAKYSPWEDFAESFAEYILVPQVLIRLAPEKFKFMEEEFRKYEHDSGIQKLLQEIESQK